MAEGDWDSSIQDYMLFGCGFLPETRDVPGCGPLQDEVSGHDLLCPKIVQVKSFMCVPQDVSVCSISFRTPYVTTNDKSQLQISPVRKVESEVHREFELEQTKGTVQTLQRDSLNINKSLLRVPERENDTEPQSFDSYYTCQSELQNEDQLITSSDSETLPTISADVTVKEEVARGDMKASNDSANIPPQLNEDSTFAQDFEACDQVRTLVMTKDNIVTKNAVRTLVKGGTDEKSMSLNLTSKDQDNKEIINISKMDERLEDALQEAIANSNNGLHSDKSTGVDVLDENTQVKELGNDYELSYVNKVYVQILNSHEKQINRSSHNLQGQHAFNRLLSCPSTESETNSISFDEEQQRDFEYTLELQQQLNHEILMEDEVFARHLDKSQHQMLSPRGYGSRRRCVEEMMEPNPPRMQQRLQHGNRHPSGYRHARRHERESTVNRDGQKPEDISLHTNQSHRNSQGNSQSVIPRREGVAGASIAEPRRDRPLPQSFEPDLLQVAESIPRQSAQIYPNMITLLPRNCREDKRQLVEQGRQLETREWGYEWSYPQQNWRGSDLLPDEGYPSLDVHSSYYDPDEVFEMEDGEQYVSRTQQLSHEIFMEDEALARCRIEFFGPRAEEMISLNPQRRQRRQQDSYRQQGRHSHRQPGRHERESTANRDGRRNRGQNPENVNLLHGNNRGHAHNSHGHHGNPQGIRQHRVAVAGASVADVRQSCGRVTNRERFASHWIRSYPEQRIERIPGQSAQIDPSVITPLTRNYQEERRRREEQRRGLESRVQECQCHYQQPNWRTGFDRLPNEDYTSVDVHPSCYDPDEVFEIEDGEQYLSITEDSSMSRRSLTRRRPTFPIPAHQENFDDSRIPLEFMEETLQQGLDQEHIERLPVHRFHAGNAGENTQCHICLNAYCDNDEIRTLLCLHKFHMACIDHWLVDNAVCPLCRQRICP